MVTDPLKKKNSEIEAIIKNLIKQKSLGLDGPLMNSTNCVKKS